MILKGSQFSAWYPLKDHPFKLLVFIKRLHILKQIRSFKLLVYLSMCDLLVNTKH